MDRWVHEYMNRAPGFSNSAAEVGSTCHLALEMYVQAVYIDKTHQPGFELLKTFYHMAYVKIFETADIETTEYRDGYELIKRWFPRNKFQPTPSQPWMCVETVEVKETIRVPYNHPDGTVHEVDFNYIIDRVDQLEETVWEVVDYKSIRVPIQPEDLETKIQARAYALAMQIKHPNATKIKVTFDLLRHEPVSLWFTRDDNIAFWRYLCEETQRIVNLREEDVRPSLNMECGYCVKKFTCPLMKKNIAAGGIMAISDEEAVVILNQIESQLKANKIIKEQLEEKLFIKAATEDILNWEVSGPDGETYEVEIGSSRRRAFDAQKAAEIMGPELFAQQGNMTIGSLEKIIKDASLPQEMRDRLADLLYWNNGNLNAKIKPKKTVV